MPPIKFDENGHEIVSSVPVATPLRFTRPPSTLDEVRRAIGILNREAYERGTETFEEADDFEIGDDFDPSAPYELTIDNELATEPPPPPPPVAAGGPGAGVSASPPGAPAPVPPAPVAPPAS